MLRKCWLALANVSVRVYHFTSAVYGLEDVRLRRLKIATLRDINDPFELAVRCNDSKRRRALRNSRIEWGQRIGMLCFSAGWHNPVQWSHYAEKHRGVCLGFDVPDSLLVRVRYTKMPPQLDWDAIENHCETGEAEMIRWSTTKFEHWPYEDERRVFLALEEADDEGNYFADFGCQLALRELFVPRQEKSANKKRHKTGHAALRCRLGWASLLNVPSSAGLAPIAPPPAAAPPSSSPRQPPRHTQSPPAAALPS